jgi:hypothetical protein
MISSTFSASRIIESKLMQEGRRAERVKSFLRAQIIYNNRMTTIDCVVKNISPVGARLALNESMSVPSEFDLYIPQKGRTYRARMAWRDTDAIGVEFMTGDTQQQHQPAQTQDMLDGNSLDSRLRALELQNAELKIRIRDLIKRLEDLGQDPNIAA